MCLRVSVWCGWVSSVMVMLMCSGGLSCCLRLFWVVVFLR